MKDGDSADDTGKLEEKHPTPLLDELEDGPWPSFVTGLKRLRDEGAPNNQKMMNDLLGQLNHSYENRMGYWKGGTVSVFGYGGGSSRGFRRSPKSFLNQRNSTRCGLCRPRDFTTAPIFCANWPTSGNVTGRA